MRAFVTGATGFLGGHLIRALKQRGDTVIGFLHDGHNQERETTDHWSFGDLSDQRKLERILAEYEIDTVFHLAAITQVSVAGADPVGTFEANVRGTWNLLDACRRQKTRRVIVAATDKAYGRSAAPYSEDTPLTPDRPYETSKACVDLIARTYAATYNMSVAVTRCVNLYGPGHLNFSTLIPGTIRRVLHNEAPVIRNGGQMKRDFLFVRDAVAGYLKLAESSYRGAINFGTNTGWSIKQVVEMILHLMGSSFAPIEESDSRGEIIDQWSDYQLAEKVLQWTPETSLVKGLMQTIAWYRDYFAKKEAA